MRNVRSVGRVWSRRDFLKVSGGALAGAYVLGLTGCGGSESESATGELAFQTWAGEAEEKAFRDVIKRYEEQNPDVTVKMEILPFGQMYEKLDTRLAAGQAPDITRVQYQAMGRYSSQGALVDLSEYLDSGYGDAFTPGLWQATNYEDTPFGIPHHTDTYAIFYNTEIFDQLGIEVPQSLEESWTWDEFIQISNQIKESGAAKFPFAMDWQGDTQSYRWMWFLHQHGGQLLTDDLSGPQIDNTAGIETIAWNQSWFNDGLVPPSSSIKSGEEVENLFANGTTAMMLNGDWLIPFLEENMSAGWDVTYMIQDKEMASDLGGNALAVTKDSKNAEAAADFVKFATNEENMRRFCVDAQFVPVRTSLVDQQLDFKLRPEQMNLFVEQSKTVPEQMAKEQTIPEFNKITLLMADELEAAFKTGQSPEETANNISSGIEEVLA